MSNYSLEDKIKVVILSVLIELDDNDGKWYLDKIDGVLVNTNPVCSNIGLWAFYTSMTCLVCVLITVAVVVLNCYQWMRHSQTSDYPCST